MKQNTAILIMILSAFISCSKSKETLPGSISSSSAEEDAVVTGGMVFMPSTQGILFALDAATGNTVWQYAPYSHFVGTGCVANNIVYTFTDYPLAAVHALDASTGNVIWIDTFKTRTYSVSSAPVIFKKTVFINIQSKIYALDAQTGAIKWQQGLGGVAAAGVASTPTVAGGTLYCGTTNSLAALDASNGNVKWSYPTGVVVTSSPCVANGVVYFTGNNGNSYAVDTSGILKWVLPQYNDSYYSSASPTYYNGIIYGTTHSYPYSTILRALDANTGALIWKDSISVYNSSGGAEYADPSYFKGVIYERIVDSLYAYDALTGNKKWSFYLPADPNNSQVSFSGPCTVPGVVYITDRENTLYALNSKSGTLLWSFNYGGAYYPSPFVLLSNGKTYHASISGMTQ
ncbi:MAG TPA: PQQ-binding-like beta-propeller repeat protein [Panacibacter sp.]|nr:PQQ-binding-like beta-propeller repeat protein [Panacibacter sp.]